MEKLSKKILVAMTTKEPYKVIFDIVNTVTDKAVKYEEAVTDVCISVFKLANLIVEENKKEV